MKKFLLLATAFLAFANLLNAQSLGNYRDTTVNEGSSINITPSAAPSGITRLSAYSDNGSFTGSLTVSPTTGVITVVNPTGVGTYPIVVKSSNGVTKTFNLTVDPPFCAKKAYQTPVSIKSVATGGDVAIENLFTDPALTNFTATGTGVSWTRYTNMVYGVYSNNANGSFQMNQDISLVGKAKPTFTFTHIIKTENNYDFGRIEYSTNSGSSWTAFPSSAYRGSGTLATAASVNGTIAFQSSSYNYTYTDGHASQDWRNETIDLTAYIGSPTFRVRFRLTGDYDVSGTGWSIKDVGFKSGDVNTYGSAYPRSAAIGDFNKDGKKDIVISNQGSTVTHTTFRSYASINVKMGDGLGGFGADNIIGVGTNANNMVYGEVEVGDVNADGNDDIVVIGVGGAPNYTVVYLGNGTGGFATPIYYSIPASASCLSIKDINKDGYNDLVYKAGSPSLTVLLNSGSQTDPFGTNNTFVTSLNQWGTNFVFDDFNRDGNIDFAYMGETIFDSGWGFTTHTLRVFHGNGAGSFSWAYNVSSGQSTTQLTSNSHQLALTDVNNDGRNDVVAVGERNTNAGTSITYFNLSYTNPPYLTCLGITNICTNYAEIHPLSTGIQIATGDFNGDGKNDISIAYNTSPSAESKYIVLYGNGTFYPSFCTDGSTPIHYTGGRGVGNSASKFISGDFDSNGRLDLLTVNPFSDNITLIKPSGVLTNADISPISLSTPTTYTSGGVAISASNICLSGGAAAISSTVTGGYNPKFTWYKNGTPISRFDSAYQYGAIWVGSTSLYYMYEANSSGNYSVSAKNDNKTCPSLDTNIVFSTSTAVSFRPTLTPTVTITSTTPGIDTSYCINQFYTINADITNAGTNPTVAWYYNGNTLITNTANTIISNNGRTISINGQFFGGNENRAVHCVVTPTPGGCYFTTEGGSTGVKTSNTVIFGRPKGELGNAAIRLTADGNASQVCSNTYMVFSANPTGMDVANSKFDWKNYSYNSTTSTYTLIYNSGPGNATGLATNVDGLSIIALEVTPYIDGCLLTLNKITEVITMGPNSAAASNSFRIINTIIPNANIGNENSNSFTFNTYGFSFVIGNRAYIGGGNGSTRFWSYEAGTRSGLRRETDMPFASYEGTAFTSNGKGYVLGGRNGNNYNLYSTFFYEYDPVTKVWTNKSTALVNTDLIYSHANATFTINDFGYIGGGRSSTTSVWSESTSFGTAKWYKYDPINNQFYNIADYPNNATNALYNGIAFSAAGKGFFLKMGQLYKYDPDANSWSNTNRGYPISGYYAQSAFTIGNYAYVGLGILQTQTSDTKNFYEFNGLTEQWTGGTITSFGVGGGTAWTGMHAATGFSIGNKGYIVGGRSVNAGNASNPNLYEFTPQYTQRSVVTYGLQSLNLCKGSTLTLKFNAGNANCGSLNFPSDNIFTAQLSDENGSFHNPTTIGSLTSTALTGSITFTIPTSVTAGTRYRIRVNASSPRTIGFDNGINITIGDPASPGSISHDYSIPYPTELTLDSVKNTASVLGAINGYFWQKSNDTSNASGWGVITDTSINRTSFVLPTNYTNDVYIRRAVVLGCLSTVYTNPVKIRVYSSANGRLNGSISGSVKSSNGVGVYGVPIFAQKRSALLGSPQSKIYQTTTDISGAYIIPNIFYGDLNNGDSASAIFKVWPSLANHGFTPDTLLAELSNVIYTATDKNFIDTSTYSVRGKVMQICDDCDPGFQSDSLSGVQINITKGSLSYPSGTTGSDGYGRYGVTFTDPGSYKFVPSKTGNTFTPVERTVNIVNSDLTGMNFTNTTRYNISGLFRAGANEVIGTATLEFSDTMVPARFKKTITTNSNGTYSVSLPARTYNIRVIDFSPNTAGNDISTNDLITWFNTTIKDSLQKISIDGSSKTVDLIYHRAPVLYLENLPDTSCGNYVVFKQDASRPFRIKVYEGDSSHRALLSYDTLSSIEVITNVQVSSTLQTLSTKPVNGVSNVALTGGAPNIAGDFLKQLFVDFEDMYGRRATRLERNAVVLGLKSDPSTFTTVSPSVPILILHAPPGDQSISFWEQNKTTETAMSFSSLSDRSTNAWVDVKVGTEFTAGIGFSVETSIWANVNTSITNSQRVTNAREAILSSSTSVAYATEPNGGDVYVGGAINLAYAISNELLFRSDTTVGCVLGLKSSLAIAPKGFATTYTYSESFITDNLIPRLELQASMSPDSTARKLINQISIWQQVIANNNANKDRAEFVRNRSFDGNAGPITESTTSTSTNTNTIAFELEIDKSVAIEAGLDIGGIGVSGGATIDMRMTTGNSTTNTATTSTTMGYTLDDDDAGDFYSVDIKKDPVYNTPVFVLVAGTASCPAEPIAQSRDNVQLAIPTPEIRNIPANGEALFQLQLQNISESGEARTYYLTFNQSSNPNGALVTIGGSPVTSNISYTIPYLGSQTVTVSVRKSNASSVFSYEGLQFTMSDACDGGVSESKTISAYFISPCSDLILNAPVNNWVAKSSDNNILPVIFTGYNLSNLQSVALEYAHAGRGDWVTDTILYQNFITNPTNTTLNWNIADIADGEYDIRMKLNCLSGSGYTQRLTGKIDRKAPILFGLPKPTSGIYTNGDEISMSYTEDIATTNLDIDKVKMTRLFNGADIPVQVSGYQNKVMIVPLVNINAFAPGEVIRVTTKNISDVYGNISAVEDTFAFTIGTAMPTTTTRQVKVSNLITTKRSVFENAGDSLQVRFSVPTASTFNTVVHYVVSGSAVFANDYNNTFSAGQNLTTTFNGVQGTINIPANATWAVLNIKPISDDDIESNETVTIRLLSGGDYTLGADSTSVLTDTIKNDDITKPEVTLGDLPTTSPNGYCQIATDTSVTKLYVWNVPTTLPSGYCETVINDSLLRPYVWNVPETLPVGYCTILMNDSLAKPISIPPSPTTLPLGYCVAEAPYNADEQIYSVSFGSMNNVQLEDCANGYTDYSATISAPTVLLGDVIPFSVNTDECDAAQYYASGLSIYLDYNRDGDFDDAGEQAYTTTETMISPNIRSGNIQIPTTATRGLTKMRVVMSEGNPSPASCGNMGYGEVEDYAVMIDSIVVPPSILEDEQIFAVSFGAMNNTQSENCSTNYTDYSANIAAPVVTIGETVPFSVLTDECDAGPYFASGMSVFIDYNRDGDFDDVGEQAYTTDSVTLSPNTRSGNIVIPADAALGLTKMRIVVAENVASPGSCISLGYGEVEDYSIMIHGIPPAQSVYEDQQIKAVSFGSMNNTQSDDCSANYTDYTATIAAPIVTVGTAVPFSVFTDECDAAPYYASGMSIFIDYNRDGDFEDFGELAYTNNETSVSPNTRSGNIFIPTDATQGLTKMRVVVQDGVAIPGSCATLGYGEVEDYAIMIHGVEPVLSVLDDEQIKSVGFGTMENVQSDNCNANYTDYSSTILPPVVSLGESVPFSVLTDECDMAPYYASGMSIFIDYNRDGDFNDAGEKAYTTNGTTMSPNTRSGEIEIPATASVGVTKMRIVVAEGVVSPESCTAMGYGEVEDYNIMIKNPAPPTICQGGTGSLYGPTSIDGQPIYLYVWKLNGTLLNANSRILSINAPGSYTLKVYTNTGFSSISMPYVVTSTAPPTSDDYNEICPSELPFMWNGTAYTASGNYSKLISNANGCDSIATLHLTVKSNSYSVETVTAIDTFVWHGNVYDVSTNTPTWTGSNYLGCDSIVTLNLTIIPMCLPIERVYDIIACNSYTWHGIRFTNSAYGIEWTTQNYRGCDSTEILNLTINRSSTSTTNMTVCAIQLPILWNNVICSNAGTFTKRLTNAAGCDSVATLVLSVKLPTSSTQNIAVCANDMPYNWNGVDYNSAGTYVQNLTNAVGCDSTATLNLSVKQVSTSNHNISICSSQLPIVWNGLTLTAAGNYIANLNSANGCDSLAILNLTVNQVSYVTETINATGTSYTWHGVVYTSSNNTATWTGTNAAGCDSIVTLDLTLTNDCVPTTRIFNVTACSTYTWRGIRLTSSTTLEWVGVNAGGCDSTEVLNLTITSLSPTASPASITQTLVNNVCGARVYRYTASEVTNASGYSWLLPVSVGGRAGVFVDSGNVSSSRVILVRYASTLAAFATDSVKVRAFSACGATAYRSAKLINTLFTVPAAPASITITPIETKLCGAKRYRFTAPVLPIATTTTVAATGYVWAFTGVLGASIDSGTVNSKVITVTFSSNAAAATGDSVKLCYTSSCGNSLNKASKLTNTLLSAPAAPTVTVSAVQTNVCGARKYRYKASNLALATTFTGAATGWLWSLPAEGTVGSTGTLDSGTVNSQTIVVVYTSNAAAAAGDSIRVRFTSNCGLGLVRATKLTNTALTAPLAPATVTIATVSDICGARVYRYTAPTLPLATATAGAATGYVWSMPIGTLGSNGILDSGSLTGRIIRIRYSSNVAAVTGDSIKVLFTSNCGNSLAKAQKLSNVAPTLLAASTTLTGTTSICPIVGTSTSASYTATAVTGAQYYVWSLPSGAVIDSGSNGLKIRIRFNTAGANDSIFVQAVGINGCAGTKKVLKLVTTGCVTLPTTRTVNYVKPAEENMLVNVYPNPTTSSYQLYVQTSQLSQTIKAKVFDVQGRLMKVLSFNSNETIAFGSELKAGVYMVQVREGDKVKTVRVVKF